MRAEALALLVRSTVNECVMVLLVEQVRVRTFAAHHLAAATRTNSYVAQQYDTTSACNLQKQNNHTSKRTYIHIPPAETMHERAPELQPVLAPPGCQVSDLGGESPSGSSTRCTTTRAEESRTTIDDGESDGTASSS